MPLTISLRPGDRVRLQANADDAPAGVDLAATVAGLHRVARSGAQVLVDSTFDQGATWSQVMVAADAADDSIPTIAAAMVGEAESVFVAYHDVGGSARIYRSGDHGASWSARQTLAGATFPRLCFALDGHFLAAWSGGDMDLYRSEDWFGSAPGSPVFSLTMAEQLVVLRSDRHNRKHLVWQVGADLHHRGSADGVDWDAAAVLVAGREAVAAAYGPPSGYAPEGGVVLFWDGADLYAQSTAADYENLAGSAAAVPLAVPAQQLGVAVDRHEVSWLVGQSAANNWHTCWSKDRINWTAL